MHEQGFRNFTAEQHGLVFTNPTQTPKETESTGTKSDPSLSLVVFDEPTGSETQSDQSEAVVPAIGDGRGARVFDSRHAEKLRSGKNEELPAIAKQRLANNDGLTAAIKNIKRFGIVKITAITASTVLLAILSHECTQALSFRENWDAGLKAFNSADMKLAISKFNAVIAAAPGNSDGYYYRAMSQILGGSSGTGSDKETMQDLDKAIALDSNNQKAHLARAALALRMQRWEIAVNDCTAILATAPSFEEAYRIRAAAYNHQFLFTKAIEDSTQFLNRHSVLDSARADALSKRAFAYDQKHEYAAAIKDYTDAIACDAENASHYVGRAIVYMHKHEWQSALADTDIAMAARPSEPAIYKVRALSHEALGKQASALKDLDKLVALLPNADSHRMRGERRLASHRYLGSLEDFQAVIEAEPDDAQTGRKFERVKRILQRGANYKSMLASQPEEVEPKPLPDTHKMTHKELLKKGHELIAHGDPEFAIQYLVPAVKADPHNAKARKSLAHAYNKTGRTDKAAEQFSAQAKLAPMPVQDKFAYAYALVQNKSFSKAKKMYEEILAVDPKNDRARSALITMLLQRGRTEEASAFASEGTKQSASQNSKYSSLLRSIAAREQQIY